MYFAFDLRTTTRDDVMESIRKLEASYTVTSTVAGQDQILTVWAEPKVIDLVSAPQFDPNTLPGLIQFGTKLQQSVDAVNQKPGPKMSNITGASQLGSAFRDLLNDVKAQLAKATEEMNGAMTELKDTTSQATQMVKQVKTETADLKAALGLNSNNPPA